MPRRCSTACRAFFADRLYVELARRGKRCGGARPKPALVELAYARDLPLVADKSGQFLPEPHMHKAHDAMLCIAGSTHIDAEERARSNPESYVKTYHMMEEAFDDPAPKQWRTRWWSHNAALTHRPIAIPFCQASRAI